MEDKRNELEKRLEALEADTEKAAFEDILNQIETAAINAALETLDRIEGKAEGKEGEGEKPPTRSGSRVKFLDDLRGYRIK